MKREIRNGETVWVVDESTTLEDIRRGEPGFFSAENQAHFNDQSYSVHRGQLIVREIQTLSDKVPRTKYVVYLFYLEVIAGSDKGRTNETFCAGWPRDEEEAERLIDYILETGEYHYGIKPPDDWQPASAE
jgi:hypothetical protein